MEGKKEDAASSWREFCEWEESHSWAFCMRLLEFTSSGGKGQNRVRESWSRQPKCILYILIFFCCCCCCCCWTFWRSWRWSCCGNTKNYLHKYPRCQLCVVACKVTEAHKMAPLPQPLPLLLLRYVRDCTFFSQPFYEYAKWAWLSNANVRLSACLALYVSEYCYLCVCVCCCGWRCIWAGGQTSTLWLPKFSIFHLIAFN